MGILDISDQNEDIDYEHISSTSNQVNMIAGAAAGMAEHCLVYPLDLIKV